MQRTPADRARRRHIASAASGGIQRAHVALYVCNPSGDTDRILTDLRAYAAARDWIVADELVDNISISEPTDQRPQWAKLAQLIESGQVQGIVTPMRRMCGLRESEQTSLNTWLAAHHAFVVNVWGGNRELAAGA
ncbi:hypothetical protein ACIOC2_19505 [Streptomyces sp. NPDC088337]|uniref:hypothetical protein n=1 Tax=unclassified Streptomyces TaxID=2593676 RepID=UPI00380D1E55